MKIKAATSSDVSVSVETPVLEAKTNAYVVDQTLKSKISTDNTIMDSQAQSYVDTDTVNPGDDLEFNYLMLFDNGDAISNMRATIKLPDNVTFATGTLGQVVYLSSDGTKSTSVDISSDDINTDSNSLTLPVDDIGTGKDYASARIVLSAKAGSAGKTVAASHVDYEADNYDDAADTPKFTIKDSANSIVAATNNSSVQAFEGENFNLIGTMDYKNNDGVVFKNENMYIYYTIDGVAQLPVQDTASSDKNFSLIMRPLALGSHTITVQVVQPNYNDTGETIVSNILTYDVNVTANSLIITKDKSFAGDGYTVNDNDPVDIKGTYEHANGDPAHGTKNSLSITAQITSKADTDDPNVQDEYNVDAPGIAGTKYDDDGTFSFQVVPVVYKMGNHGFLIDQSLSYEDYIKKYGYVGLEVGKNIVTVKLTDAKGHESDETQFVINVPDVQPELSLDTTDIYSNNPNTGLGADYDIPMNVSYVGKKYQFSMSTIFTMNTLNDVSMRNAVYTSDELQTEESVISGIMMVNSLTKKSLYGFSADDPVIADKPYPASYYYRDAYGRKSNTVDYTITFRSKYISIKTDDSYKFKNFKNFELTGGNNKRDGDWGVAVESFKSSWTLTAKATPFYQYPDGKDPIKLNSQMVFVNPDDSNSSTESMENNPVVVDKYTGSSASDKVITTDVASKWADDSGILLTRPGGLASYVGTYTSTITWEAADSV
ncbi:hypothetical protein [Companilactobacillus kedongensis]|uniref:hypothetical protein n=1 Tax=Companilactobacillus kedongensis TaxID=2486004 RepID=UPI000F768C46|nr:hypothetical protein [Companilactobacillus kedongensis]